MGPSSREPDLPDVPTMIESGFPASRSASGSGCGRRPARRLPIVDKLNAATNAALRSPEMKAQHARGSASRRASARRQEFTAFIADEAPKWAEIVRTSGVQID